ncbi:MAG: protein kinase, partial [Acidobacteria bacterium]|nr:protein kinase [Acidobacteriota bacterium]
MTAHQHPAALPKGHRIGEYEIVRVLGAGGFGVTYLAFDHQLDGPVALKEYFPADAARRGPAWGVAPSTTGSRALFTWGLDRFIDEARSLHRLRHPNVVRAHRYVQAHGTAYIVMEYVEGESLQQVIRERGRLTPDAWRRWLEPLLDGLAHVHGHGYLHRDLKPANIMIRAADGTPVLIDFGAARMAARDRTHTQVLTPGYAPLEQYSRDGVQGPPTDIYALAAVSYGVLTGERLPSAPDRVLDDDYEPLANRIQEADRRWLAAIDHGLALRPEDRPQTVPAWTAAIRGARGAPVPEVDAEARPSRNVGRAAVPQQDDSASPGRASRALMYFVSAAAVFFWLAVIVREPPEFLPGQEAAPGTDRSPGGVSGRNDPSAGVPNDPASDLRYVPLRPSGNDPSAGVPNNPAPAPANRSAAQTPAIRSSDLPNRSLANVSGGNASARRSPPVSSPEAGEARLGLDWSARRVIQRGLRADGFDPGSVDGLFGPATRASLRAWQISRGQAATGYLNGQQVAELRDSARRQPPRTAAATFATRPTVPASPEGSTPNPSPSISVPDGWRLAPRPTAPASPEGSTPNPSPSISVPDGWRLAPRPKVATGRSFTRGSHENEVLRLQGTPTSIDRYPASG